LWGHNAISDESPALVEEGVLHPVEYKSRDLPKKRTLNSLEIVYKAFYIVFYGFSSLQLCSF
jgi:hypothetical protein